MDLQGRLALMVAVLAAAGLGWMLWQRRRGVLRAAPHGDLPLAWAQATGERFTLVQVSSEVCASCDGAARVWTDLAAGEPGVTFVRVDAADHLDVVRELGIFSTPTTLVYDGAGSLRGRVTGAPTPRQAAQALQTESNGALR